MSFTVQVIHITFERNEKRGEDGAVWYLILSPCSEDPCTHTCELHPRMVHSYERQAFRLGANGHRLDATPREIAEDKANVWGWDGNREAPTIRPSFLAMEHDKKGKVIRPYRLHSYLTAGRLEVLGDSTVVLDPAPKNCWDM